MELAACRRYTSLAAEVALAAVAQHAAVSDEMDQDADQAASASCAEALKIAAQLHALSHCREVRLH